MPKLKPSKELAAMHLATAKSLKARLTQAEKGLEVTRVQVVCEKIANRILRKAGFFAPKEAKEEVVMPAEAVGSHGLRPTWHGRA